MPFDSRDLGADIRDVLDGLNLSPRDLAWTSPEVVAKTRVRTGASKGTRPQRSNKLIVTLSPGVSNRLRKVQGNGSFPSMLCRFEKRVKGTTLVVTSAEVQRLLSHSAN